MNWTLINIIGYIVIIVLSIVGAAVVVLVGLIVASLFYDRRRLRHERAQPQEPITQVRVTVPRRQDVPDAFYRAFEQEA
jgi:hypothetical protein